MLMYLTLLHLQWSDITQYFHPLCLEIKGPQLRSGLNAIHVGREKHVGRSGLRSTVQESFILYDVPFNKMSTFSDRGFMTASPKLWNDLQVV